MARYSLPNTKPWVSAAAEEVGPMFGITSVGGYRTDNDPQDHGKGLALDLMTTAGDNLAEYLRINAVRLGITYVIWNKRIWSLARNSEGWRPYSGASTHEDHVHASFKDSAPSPLTLEQQKEIADATAKAGLGATSIPGFPGLGTAVSDPVTAVAGAIGALAPSVAAVGKLAEWITKLALPSNIIRITCGIAGAVLLLVGLNFLKKEVAN